MKTISRSALKTAAGIAAAKAMTAGAKKAREWAIAADAALIKAGKAASLRQRKRARAAALKTAGRIALAAGAVAASVMTVRAVARNVRRGSTVE